MNTAAERIEALQELLATRILVLDGAMGTMLQDRNLTAADFGGAALEGCNEYLVKTRPDVILDIHRAYLAAGSDIIETNTFRRHGAGAGRVRPGRSRLTTSASRRRTWRGRRRTISRLRGKPRFVAGSMGPTTKAITVTGGVTFAQLIENFHDQAKALVDGGVDILLVETRNDTRNVKAALLGIQRLEREIGRKLPVMVSGTIEPMGTMLAGQTADALSPPSRTRICSRSG